MRKDAEGSGETRLENWVSYILIVGVLTSLFLEVAGVILFYRVSHSTAISHDRSMFIQGKNFFTFLYGTLCEASSGITALRLMILGAAILILTPYARTIMAVIYFASRKNIKYLFITLFVLAVLTLSLAIH